MTKEHICIGCGTVIEVPDKWHDFVKKQTQTVCDNCFYDVADIILDNKNNPTTAGKKLQERRIKLWREQLD